MAKRAVIYVRISRDRVGAGLGVQRQEKDCKALCEARGWEVAEVCSDNDLSAYSGKPRPGYDAVLRSVKDANADVIVAWHVDRLLRSPRELEDLIDLLEATGATVATVMAGDYDLGTAAGRMTARVVGAVARNESEQKRERIQAMHRQLAERGKWKGGGCRPFGYDTNPLRVRDEEAVVVREMAERVLRGESIRSLCAELQGRGVPTVGGGRWTQTVLRRILTAPFGAGLREHNGVVVGPGEWPAVIDDITHARLRRVLLDPGRRTNRSARSYLLTGLLRCSRCEAVMVSRPKADKRRGYVCAKGAGFHGCGGMGALAETLEAEVVERLLTSMADGSLGIARASESVGTEEALLEQTSAEIRDRLDVMAADYAEGIMDRQQFGVATVALQRRLDDTQRALSRFERARVATAVLPASTSLTDDWEALSFDQRRAVVLARVETVTLLPAVKGRNFFDPHRVKVKWR